MGTWGTGIFDGDTASDVRDDWREAIVDGLDPEEATAHVLQKHAVALAEPDDGVVVWVALAAAQSETGRLQPNVRDRALAIIEGGGDLARWEESGPAAVARRRRALTRLAETLRGPQKSPTRLRRPRPQITPHAVGDVIRVRGEDGESEGLFVVVDHADGWPPGSRNAVLATLLWTGGPLPSRDEMHSLPLVVDDEDGARRPLPMLHIVHSPTSGRLALANFGEVVETDVQRRDAPDHRGADARRGPRVGYCTWVFLSGWVAGEWFRRCVELTRRLHGID